MKTKQNLQNSSLGSWIGNAYQGGREQHPSRWRRCPETPKEGHLGVQQAKKEVLGYGEKINFESEFSYNDEEEK